MSVDTKVRTHGEHMELLRRLLEARGLDRYGLYLLTSENTFTPTGYEEMSGYVLGADGGTRFFWIGWDEPAQREEFKIWRPVEWQVGWLDDEEFQEAYVAAMGPGAGPAEFGMRPHREGAAEARRSDTATENAAFGGATDIIGVHGESSVRESRDGKRVG